MKTSSPPQPQNVVSRELSHYESDHIDRPYDVPDSPTPAEDPDEPSDLNDFDAAPDDDTRWEVFIPDDEYDREPDLSDFEGSIDPEAWAEDFD